jgi:hypothetical protein
MLRTAKIMKTWNHRFLSLHYRQFSWAAIPRDDELVGSYSVAGNARHGDRRLARGLAIKAASELGVLVVHSEQCALGYLGMACPRLRAHCASVLPGYS